MKKSEKLGGLRPRVLSPSQTVPRHPLSPSEGVSAPKALSLSLGERSEALARRWGQGRGLTEGGSATPHTQRKQPPRGGEGKALGYSASSLPNSWLTRAGSIDATVRSNSALASFRTISVGTAGPSCFSTALLRSDRAL